MGHEKTRDQIEDVYKWDLKPIFKNDEEWKKAFAQLEDLLDIVVQYKGSLDNAQTVHEFLLDFERYYLLLERISNYAFLNFTTDTAQAKYQEMSGKVDMFYSEAAGKLVFISQELSRISESDVDRFIEEVPELEEYAFHLKGYARFAPHILSEETEEALSEIGVVVDSSSRTFEILENADLQFPTFEHKGEEYHMSHANYSKFLQSEDREFRKKSYEAYLKPFNDYRNTFASTYGASVLSSVKAAKIRKYENSLQKNLFPDYLPVKVYTNLTDVVAETTEVLTQVNNLKIKELGIDELHGYDNLVPIVSGFDKEYSYKETQELFEKAIQPLGEDYLVRYKSHEANKVVDVFPSKGKRSGAYQNIGYETGGYVFLNHTETMNDVFTYVHEWGHAMHSVYSNEYQNFYNADTPIFLAEIASTLNEILLSNYLIKNAQSDLEKKYHIFYSMNRMLGTFYRQGIWAIFEKQVHESVEQGHVLTADYIDEIYASVMTKYNGDNIVFEDIARSSWARIPHFYAPFYVYKYATSLCAAQAFADRILNQEDGAVEDYIKFLSSGSYKEPLQILKDAGIDMTKKETFQVVPEKLQQLLDEYKSLM